MALFTPGQTLSDVRGSVGSVTAKGVRGGLVLQAKSRGRANPTRVSVGQFGLFGAVSARWSGLTLEQRQAWDVAAGGSGLGLAAFVRVVYRRFSASGEWDFSAPIHSVCGAILTVALEASAIGPAFVITWTSTAAATEEWMGIEVCAFASAASKEPRGGWLGPVYDRRAASGTVDLGPVLMSVWNVFQPGRWLGVRLHVFDYTSGKCSQNIYARARVDAGVLMGAVGRRQPEAGVRWHS